MTGAWRDRTLPELLAEHGLADAPEAPFPTDGWSGATFTTLTDADGRRYVLKRTSLAIDWIARATRDADLREAWLAAIVSTPGVTAPFPYLGAATDGDGAAILMPELAQELIAWERPGFDPVIDVDVLDRVLGALAHLHGPAWHGVLTTFGGGSVPWCPLPDRLRLLTRASAAGYAAAGNPVGDRFLAGWDAFDRLAPADARDVIDALTADVTPLVDALARLPAVLLHGDLKLANVALLDAGVAFIDWQMFLRAPVAVELGWMLVSNSGSLPVGPAAVLDRYRSVAPAMTAEDWATQVDLAMLVGLLLRGWRKGLDAEAGATLGSGIAAADDLGWWCGRAVEAAGRRL